MRMTTNDMINYIEALEAANDQLVIALKRCLELLANVPPEVADKEAWQSMMEDFNKLVKVGERIISNKTLH